ncbi:chorismate mutase [candidate division KSB1 bacterium]|jgi:chorismate mutase|nr:MAG: chorismate mutase [candidate division KSB1 bacterium]
MFLESVEQQLNELRIKIDTIDHEIVKLLNRRAELANKIGEIKRAHGIPVYVPEREEQVIANVRKSNPGPLSGEAISRIYERIIDESRRLEREEMERRKQAAER